jgi:hypothetical protein
VVLTVGMGAYDFFAALRHSLMKFLRSSPVSALAVASLLHALMMAGAAPLSTIPGPVPFDRRLPHLPQPLAR